MCITISVFWVLKNKVRTFPILCMSFSDFLQPLSLPLLFGNSWGLNIQLVYTVLCGFWIKTVLLLLYKWNGPEMKEHQIYLKWNKYFPPTRKKEFQYWVILTPVFCIWWWSYTSYLAVSVGGKKKPNIL